MNVWECEAPGCKTTAAGIGDGYGLRAIGWYFKAGPIIFCPFHHPKGIEWSRQQAWLCRSYGVSTINPDINPRTAIAEPAPNPGLGPPEDVA